MYPESFIPAYPAGLGFGTVVGSRTEAGREQFREYWENSVEVGAEETQQLGKWAKEYGIYITIGVTERDSINKTLYCTLLYFSSKGMIVIISNDLRVQVCGDSILGRRPIQRSGK